MGILTRGSLVTAAGLCLVTGSVVATDTYAGRMLRLWGPDVEDYARLPTRPVHSGVATALPERPDRMWMQRAKLRYQGRDLSDGASLDRFLSANETTAFVVLADGVLTDERYYDGRSRNSLFKSFSITKSVLSAVFGIAAAEGVISPADPVGRFVAGLDEPLASLSLQHLLDNTAGFFYERGNWPWMQQPRMYYTTDARSYVPKAAARFEHEPGSRYVGEDLSPLLLGIVLENALRRREPGLTLSEYVSRRLWKPLGAQYPALFTLDRAPDGLEKVESGFTARAVDLARFGQLFLDGGVQGGRRVVPAEWVSASTTPPARDRPNSFPHGFHRNLWWGHYRPGQSRSDFFANGHFGQRIYVSPDKRLVLVRLGASSGNVDWTRFMAAVAASWTPPAADGPESTSTQGRQNFRSP